MTYHRKLAVAYARKWAKSTNPRYIRFGNDCTNFVSQCLHEGGFPMEGARDYDQRWSEKVWWYDPNGVSGWLGMRSIMASYSWSGADMFAKRLEKMKLAIKDPDHAKLDLGDVIQLSDGAQMRHTMIITGFDGAGAGRDPLVSYHTSDHLDEPLSAILGRSSRTPVYWRIK